MTTDDMMKEIQETVRKSLPAHLSDELKRALDERAQLKKDKESLEYARDSYKKERDDYKTQLDHHSALARRELNVTEREVKVLAREKFCDIAEYKVQAAIEKVEFAKDIVHSVFQNNRFKYQQSDSSNSYNNGQSVNSSVSKSIVTDGEPQ